MIPNYVVKDGLCEKVPNDEWTAKRKGGCCTDEEVQEIIDRADAEGADAFVMNVNHTDWE